MDIPAECLVPPPAIYDHAPSVAYSVEEVSAETLRAIIDLHDGRNGMPEMPEDWIICGAHAEGMGRVEIYLLKGLPPAARSAVKRHEFGHVNGWEH